MHYLKQSRYAQVRSVQQDILNIPGLERCTYEQISKIIIPPKGISSPRYAAMVRCFLNGGILPEQDIKEKRYLDAKSPEDHAVLTFGNPQNQEIIGLCKEFLEHNGYEVVKKN